VKYILANNFYSIIQKVTDGSGVPMNATDNQKNIYKMSAKCKFITK